MDSNARTIWIADAHRGDGKRFVVRADEKLTAFVKLESEIRPCWKLSPKKLLERLSNDQRLAFGRK